MFVMAYDAGKVGVFGVPSFEFDVLVKLVDVSFSQEFSKGAKELSKTALFWELAIPIVVED